MKYLLDTCVISQLAKPGDSKVKDFIAEQEEESLFLSVITIGEITKGISFLEKGLRKTKLEGWLTSIKKHYADKLLPISVDTSEIWGSITAKEQTAGRILSVADGLIAASAIEHGLTLVTRNIKDFSGAGAMLLNPWDS